MPKAAVHRRDRTVVDDGEEDRITTACEWLRKTVTAPMSEAATKFQVGYHKLRRRYKELNVPPKQAQHKRRVLSPPQERVLVAWMRLLAAQGTPVSREALRVKVERLTGCRPSTSWVNLLHKRYPELGIGRSNGLDPKRAKCFNPTAIKKHFNELRNVLLRYGPFFDKNIYNMDEKGAQMGGGRKSTGIKYFFDKRDRARYRKRSASLELVTIIECVSADGVALTPGFIFAGNSYERSWFEGNIDREHLCVGTSHNGWTDDEQCLKWFEHTFIPQARKRAGNDTDPILLIVDGHGSHCAYEMAKLGLTHNVHLFRLPPHTTHKTQPLDVGCFGLLSRKWLQRCEEVVEETGETISRGNFIKEYFLVRDQCLTKEVIVAAWKKTGLWPYNADIFAPEEFAPSHSTSILAHVPASYPTPSTAASPAFPASAPESAISQPDDGDVESNSESTGSESDASEAGDNDGKDFPYGEDELALPPGYVDPHDNILPSVDSESHSPNLSFATTARPAVPSTASRNVPVGQGSVAVSTSADLLRPALLSQRPIFDLPPVHPRWSSARQIAHLQANLEKATASLRHAWDRIEAAETHCHLMYSENIKLKHSLISNDKPKESNRILRTVESHLTSERAMEFFARQDAEERVKQQQMAAKQTAKQQKNEDNVRRREEQAKLGAGVRFTKPIRACNKAELEDLAIVLGLPLLAKETNVLLAARLTSEFDNKPSLRLDSRFSEMFTRKRAAQLPTNELNENISPLSLDILSADARPIFDLATTPPRRTLPLPSPCSPSRSLNDQAQSATALLHCNFNEAGPSRVDSHYYHPYPTYTPFPRTR